MEASVAKHVVAEGSAYRKVVDITSIRLAFVTVIFIAAAQHANIRFPGNDLVICEVIALVVAEECGLALIVNLLKA